jgi:tetratricopeptide (TPR) repeat protein
MQGFFSYLPVMLLVALLALTGSVYGDTAPEDIAAEAEVRSFSMLDNASLSLYAGQTALQQGDFEEALVQFSSVTEEDPSFTAAWYLKAYCLSELDRPEEALAAVDQALLLEPQDRDSISLKEDLLEKLGRGDEAAALRDSLGTGSSVAQNTTPVTPAPTRKTPLNCCAGLPAILAGAYLIGKSRRDIKP